ncbi:MAG: carbohydrate porin [Planctomycetota bacterium]|nr:carbohydrate porin [Planctomycetota bacterium]MEC9157208.1 carbohydrate porin [Planctomycetota bacterium]MED5508448.1 carbohydrate porin [Planctomycetota bacterium]
MSTKPILPVLLVMATVLAGTRQARGQDDPNYVKPKNMDKADEAPKAPDEVILQQDDSGTLEGYGGDWEGLRHLERIQFLSNITTLRNSPTLFPLRPSEATLELLKPRPFPLGRQELDPLLGSPFSPVMSPIRNVEEYLNQTLGLNFGVYYTLLYQNIQNPIPGAERNIGTGRLDFNVVWNLWENPGSTEKDAGHDGHGLVGILVRQGNQIGVPNSVNTDQSVGSTQGLNSLYTGGAGGAATLNLLYYQQGFLDDRVVLSGGKLHPNQYIGLNFWANDEARQFLAGPFDGIQVLGLSHGSYQYGVAGQFGINESVFVNAIVTDALGTPETDFSTFDEGFVWVAAEVGWVLPFDTEELGGPTVLTAIWAGQNLDYVNGQAVGDADDYRYHWSNGFGLQLQGHLTRNLGVWAQGGVAEERMSATNAEVSVGIGLEEPFGREGDLFGAAYNWSKPSSILADSTLQEREQSIFEVFYRIQLTGSCQLSPDIQVVVDPGLRSGNETSVVLGLRLTTDF